VPDLDVPVRLIDVAERRHPDHASGLEPPHGPRVHRPLVAPGETLTDVVLDLVRMRHLRVPGVLQSSRGLGEVGRVVG